MDSQKSLFENALEVVMASLRAATARASAAGAGDVESVDYPLLEAALVETLWWQKSAEDLWEEECGQAFYRKRDASDGGLVVGGLAYARNVGGYRVDRSYEEVVYRAASTVESVVMASFGARAAEIGDGELRWPPFGYLPPLPMEDPFGRVEMYKNHIADRSLMEPLQAALGFFDKMLI